MLHNVPRHCARSVAIQRVPEAPRPMDCRVAALFAMTVGLRSSP